MYGKGGLSTKGFKVSGMQRWKRVALDRNGWKDLAWSFAVYI